MGRKCEFELTWMFDWATKLSEREEDEKIIINATADGFWRL